MKTTIHPHYRPVVFHDTSADAWFKIGSTIKTDRTVEFEGKRCRTSHLMSLPHPTCITPVSRKILRKKAVLHALISVLVAFWVVIKGGNYAGTEFAAFG